MGEDSGDKTEEPTPHKLREARKKGQISKSKELTSAILVVAAFLTFKGAAKGMWENMVHVLHRSFDLIPVEFTPGLVAMLLKYALLMFFLSMAPLFMVTFVLALLVESLQTGFLLTFETLVPKLEKLNPLEGAKKFFSLKQYVELLKSSIKMVIVIWIVLDVIKNEFFMVLIAQQLTLWQLMAFTGNIIMKVIVKVGLFYLVIAIFDFFYQRYEFVKSMRMSKKEIKDEYKRLEGDPTVKQRQRQIQRQMAQSRQMGAVPKADVVVTNPVHLALALEYKPNVMRAPIVVAKGKRLVAAAIRQLAEQNFIPIIENPPLARQLYKETEINSEIPPQYYKAVAEILAFVYNLRKKKKLRY